MKSLTIGFRVQLNKSFTQEATQPEIGYTVRNRQVCKISQQIVAAYTIPVLSLEIVYTPCKVSQVFTDLVT